MDEHRALEDRLDQYQLYKGCLKIRNDHVLRFESLEHSVDKKADEEKVLENLRAFKFNLD
jgi:hypothetical protein